MKKIAIFLMLSIIETPVAFYAAISADKTGSASYAFLAALTAILSIVGAVAAGVHLHKWAMGDSDRIKGLESEVAALKSAIERINKYIDITEVRIDDISDEQPAGVTY